MLILAGITITYTMGEKGVFQKAKEASFKTEVSSIKEQFELKKMLGSYEQNGELESEKIARINHALQENEKMMKKMQLQLDYRSDCDEILHRLLEIVIVVANGVSEDAFLMIKGEIGQLLQEIDILADLAGASGFETSWIYGIEGEIFKISVEEFSRSSLGQNNSYFDISIDTDEEREKSIHEIGVAIDKVKEQEGILASKLIRLNRANAYLEGIQEVLKSRIKSEVIKNDKIALVGLENVQNCLGRQKQLLAMSVNGTMEDDLNRRSIIQEIQQLLEEVERIATNTKNKDNVNLLNGEWETEINSTIKQLGIEQLQNDTEENSSQSLAKVENAIVQVEKVRNQLKHTLESIEGEIEFEIPEKWKNKLKIVEKDLTYIGSDTIEKQWAYEVGIKSIEN